jgi:hypothetical protein
VIGRDSGALPATSFTYTIDGSGSVPGRNRLATANNGQADQVTDSYSLAFGASSDTNYNNYHSDGFGRLREVLELSGDCG